MELDQQVKEMVEKIERRAFEAGYFAANMDAGDILYSEDVTNAYAAWRASRNEELKDAE